MAPSRYLNHCWNIVNLNLGNKLQWNFNPNSNIFIQENAFENVVCEMASICLGLNVLNSTHSNLWITINSTCRHKQTIYRKTFNISRTLVSNKIVDNSDVVGVSPVGAAPTASSYLSLHLASMGWVKASARRDEKHLNFEIWCDLYKRFYGTCLIEKILYMAPQTIFRYGIWFADLIETVSCYRVAHTCNMSHRK